jgi:PAS domain S-box-containing protein
MVGADKEELLGHTDYDFFPREQADFFRKKDIEMFSTGSTVTVDEEPLTDAAGEVHILATTKVPYRGASGEVRLLVGIIHDITELKKAQEALRRANEELEQRVDERTSALAEAQQELVRRERLAVLGHLAGGLAHQLRNPLGVIQNAVSVLARGGGSQEPQAAKALAIIREEVTRSNRIITDLLDYARIRPASRRDVALRPLVEAALAQEAPSENVHLQMEVPEALTALLDPLQVQTALCNVIRNALDAMPDGGQLGLRAQSDGELVLLMVRDSGDGVDERARMHLFEPLVTTKPQGSGLGLSTARGLIENQGGTIRLASSSADGSTFVIELPAGSE